MTSERPNNGQIPTPYLHLALLAALYVLTRALGGEPDDAAAAIMLAGAALQIRL